MSAYHNGRFHSPLSPSGAHRWMVCTPSAKLEAEFPPATSEYAEEGTLAHEVCEVKLQGYVNNTAKRSITAQVNKLKKRPYWSDEMIEHADAYVDFIKTTALGMPESPHIVIERRVDLSTYVPDGSGIADCILLGSAALHIIDYKYGKGVPVSAEENKQLMLYALGAYEAYKMLYPIKTIRMSIVQPRLSAEASTWETTVEALLAFGEQVKERAALAAAGEGEFNPDPDACRFCRARQTCRARAKNNVKLAFETKEGGGLLVGTMPNVLTLGEIGQYLAWGVDVAKWLDDLKEYALSQALLGNEVNGWKAVEGRGSRDWTDQEKAFQTIIENGTPETMLYERKALSLAQIEKLIGKKAFEEQVGDLVVKNPGKPTLVPSSDKRAAITNIVKATEVFSAKGD